IAGAVGAQSNENFALARYNANGTLDTTFGTKGKVTTDFAGNGDWAGGVAIQADGKIVAAGSAGDSSGPGTIGLARYNTNGSLDASFGNGGKVMISIRPGVSTDDAAHAIAIQSDGKIVVAGFTFDPSFGRIFAVARYNANGSLDTSFGTGGSVTSTVGGELY